MLRATQAAPAAFTLFLAFLWASVGPCRAQTPPPTPKAPPGMENHPLYRPLPKPPAPPPLSAAEQAAFDRDVVRLSDALGKTTVRTKGVGQSHNEGPGGAGQSESVNYGETGRPLLMPDEIMNLGRDVAIVLNPIDHPHYLRPVDYWGLPDAFAHLKENYPHLYWHTHRPSRSISSSKPTPSRPPPSVPGSTAPPARASKGACLYRESR